MKALALSLLLTLSLCGVAQADRITVAVASNFLVTARDVVAGFEAETGHEVALVHGSTGKLYAQIIAGAPYDVFLSADAARPTRLLAEGRAKGGPLAYAFGRLTLVLRDPPPVTLGEALARTNLTLAIADPAVAPYGIAAKEVLQGFRGDDWAKNVVLGESVGQAYAFFATGNAAMALVALSQTRQSTKPLIVIDVPEQLHSPLRQDAVLLARAADNAAAQSFMEYLDSALARSMIEDAGYRVRE